MIYGRQIDLFCIDMMNILRIVYSMICEFKYPICMRSYGWKSVILRSSLVKYHIGWDKNDTLRLMCAVADDISRGS